MTSMAWMTPEEKAVHVRRAQVAKDAAQLFIDMEKGWREYGAAYMVEVVKWAVEDGAKGYGPRPPVNLDSWMARGIREAVLEAETVSRMGPRG